MYFLNIIGAFELTLISLLILSCLWKSSFASPSWSECCKKLSVNVLGWPANLGASTPRCLIYRHYATAPSGASTPRQIDLFSIRTYIASLYIHARDVQRQTGCGLELLLYIWPQLMRISGPHWLTPPFFIMELPHSLYWNRISDRRCRWLDMRIPKLELTFWLLLSLCPPQTCGIAVT